MKKNILIMVMFSLSVFGQGLFESAIDAEDQNLVSQSSYEINGYTRGVVFGGRDIQTDDPASKAGYAELGLKVRARKGDRGDGYAEFRLKQGQEFGQSVSSALLREAYVNLYMGAFDLRIGQQVIAWGRADGVNPTNNLTPQNMLVRSPDEDDRREGNFLLKGNYTINPLRFELIWVPQYAASVLPLSLFPFPSNITLTEAGYPDSRLENSSIAGKMHIELPSIDGSVSYFRGYMPMPGTQVVSMDLSGETVFASIAPVAYKMQVTGADFATTLGAFGLRGEFAYRDPVDDYQLEAHIPNPDVQYILGLDRTWGDFSMVLQYVGRYVLDFEPVPEMHPMLALLHEKNRMIHGQQDEISHSISFRPARNFLYETLAVDLMGLVNLTTEEMYFRPKITYDVADDLSVTIGGDIYLGPEETLFGTVDESLGAVFVEGRVSF